MGNGMYIKLYCNAVWFCYLWTDQTFKPHLSQASFPEKHVSHPLVPEWDAASQQFTLKWYWKFTASWCRRQQMQEGGVGGRVYRAIDSHPGTVNESPSLSTNCQHWHGLVYSRVSSTFWCCILKNIYTDIQYVTWKLTFCAVYTNTLFKACSEGNIA